MKYIIHTDVKPYHYICRDNSNHMSLTTDINKATIFKKKETAANLVKSNLNAKKTRNYNYTYSSLQQLGYQDDLEVVSAGDETGVKIGSNESFRSLDLILDGIKDIEKYANQASEKLEVLTRNLSNIDKACIDLDHYMEFNNLSASDGWKIYKQKQKLLKIRRNVKNQIFAYQQIVNPLASYLNGNIERSIEGLKNQKYSPRIMKGLFNIEDI